MAVKLGNGNWAVKEDKLLAYNDNSGLFFNKEFDFSRGTSATYVAKDGLIKTAGIQPNVVTNGDFSDGSTDWTLGTDWTVGDSKVIGDNSDTESSQEIFPDNTSRTLRIKYTLTVDSGQVAVYMSGQVKDWKTASGTYTDTITTTSKSIEFDGRNADPFNGTITDIIVQEIQTDTPRIDFTNDTKGHLLLEPSRTNSLPYSEDFTTYNDVDLSIESNTQETLSPQGVYNATKFTATGTDPYIFKSGMNVTANTQTASIYVKGVGNSIGKDGRILFWYIGTAGGSSSSIPFTLTSNWQRVEGSSTPTSSGTLAIRVDLPNTAEVGDESYVYGFQMEEGSYATSYIPTTGAASTRNADVCNNSGTAQDFNSEEGVLYAEIAALANDGTYRMLSLSDGTTTNRISLFYQNSPSNTIAVESAGSGTNLGIYGQSLTITNSNKIAVKYKVNDCALWINGVEVATDTSFAAFSNGTFTELSFDRGDGVYDFYGKVRNLQVFTEALTDEQLEKLTS